MFARATSGDKPNNNKFSECSQASMALVMEAKARHTAGCFIGEELYLPTTTKLRKCHVFTSLCQDFCPQGGGVSPPRPEADTTPPPRRTRARHPRTRARPPQTTARHPPQADTPPQADGHCSGRYASHWNSFCQHIYLPPKLVGCVALFKIMKKLYFISNKTFCN